MAALTLRKPRRIGFKQYGLIAGIGGFLLPFLFDIEGLDEPGERILGVFILAIVFWVTEAIPLFATAALIILLQILLVSDQALWGLADWEAAPPYRVFFESLAHPALMLFLGGFFLAVGASKFALDRNLARILLRPFGSSPKKIILGLMLITAVFSMFMSNTATTATMLAAVLPVLATLDADDRLRTGLVLSIPIAANVGGIGTPVGTPPNAIAVGSLVDAGISISFLEWMGLAVPMMLVTLMAAWLLVVRLFPAKSDHIDIRLDSVFDRSRGAYILYAVFAATVLLWLTEPVHGINSNVVGFLPVVVLLTTGVFGVRELQEMPWHVLWLVAGGIALGIGMTTTGLDQWLVDQVSWENIPTALVIGILAILALVMSTVMSNSATANLLVPIGLTLALSPAVDLDPVSAGFFVAVASSLAMALPVSTPTNAIAYSAGTITTKDMAVTGAIIGVIGLALYLFVAPALWNAMGMS